MLLPRILSRHHPTHTIGDTVPLIQVIGRTRPRRNLLAVPLSEIIGRLGGALRVLERYGRRVFVEVVRGAEGGFLLGPSGSFGWRLWLLLRCGGRGGGDS